MFSKQVLMYRTHKCEPPELPEPPPPEPPQEPQEQAIPEKPELENLSVLIKRDRDAKREAKRQLYRAHIF